MPRIVIVGAITIGNFIVGITKVSAKKCYTPAAVPKLVRSIEAGVLILPIISYIFYSIC